MTLLNNNIAALKAIQFHELFVEEFKLIEATNFLKYSTIFLFGAQNEIA
jgi:hypothetical protein